jgi:exo-1,4-beta-D-glucosaminidase
LTRGSGGGQVVPVRWQDNYVSLSPGEHREIVVRYRTADLQGAAPSVQVRGWNVAASVAGP